MSLKRICSNQNQKRHIFRDPWLTREPSFKRRWKGPRSRANSSSSPRSPFASAEADPSLTFAVSAAYPLHLSGLKPSSVAASAPNPTPNFIMTPVRRRSSLMTQTRTLSPGPEKAGKVGGVSCSSAVSHYQLQIWTRLSVFSEELSIFFVATLCTVADLENYLWCG